MQKANIEENILQTGEKAVNKLLVDLKTKAEARLKEIYKLREEYEKSLGSLKDKLKDIDLTKPLPWKTMEDLEEFEVILPKIKEEEEYSFDDFFNKGLTEYFKGNYEEVIGIWTKAIEMDHESSLAYLNRGLAYRKLGKYNKAMEDYNKAIDLNPKFDFAYFIRGNAYLKLEKYEKAIEECNKAIELNPELAVAYNSRGAAYVKLGEYEKGIEDYNKTIDLDPEDASAYENLCEVRIITGDYEDAWEKFDKAFSVSTEVEDKVICSYLKCLIEKLLDRDTAESEEKFEKLLEEDFTIDRWSTIDIEKWLEKADISAGKKKFIREKTEMFKKKMK